MTNTGELRLLAVAIAAAVVVTALAFVILRLLRVRSTALRWCSTLTFPALLIALIVYVELWNPDPHGFVMVGLGSLAFLSLPFTALTAVLLTKRFA